MDVLKPPIVKIGNRRYRKNLVSINPCSLNDGVTTYERDDYQNTGELPDSEFPTDDIEFSETDSGWCIYLSVPSTFLKFIIGKKGETKKRIETETKTRIRVPNVGENHDVVIYGQDKALISSAKTRINIIVSNQRHRQAFTHFLSFPMNNETVQQSLENFKQTVFEACRNDRGVDESIFQNPLKMHLTIATLVLLNQREIDEAGRILCQCLPDIGKLVLAHGNGIQVLVQGLEYMNDDPRQVDVLYAKVTPLTQPKVLDELSELLVERFTASGFLTKQYDRVKIHMTVMNTIMRRELQVSASESPEKERVRETFDASKILQTFGDYNFGVCHIPSVDICQRWAADTDGYYIKSMSLPL